MEYAIKTKELTKKYGNKIAVDCVNINVPKGKIYALLGRNGAGKTTTMKMMLKLIRPSKGKVKFIEGNNEKEIYKKIGSIIEAPGFYENLNGYENLKILWILRGRKSKGEILKALQLVGLEKEKNKKFRDYSLGMKQRLGIAAAIMHDPEILILDEPINGLDPIGIYKVRSILLNLSHNKGKTIFISSHLLGEIEQIADVIGIMNNGKIIEEIDMEKLHKLKKHYIEFQVSHIEKAEKVIKEILGITDYDTVENKIRIYSCAQKSYEINKCLVENKIMVSKIEEYEESLEEYFGGIIGGDGIA